MLHADGDQICSITSLKAGASGCTSAIFYTQCKVAAFLKHRDIDTPGEKVLRKSLALYVGKVKRIKNEKKHSQYIMAFRFRCSKAGNYTS